MPENQNQNLVAKFKEISGSVLFSAGGMISGRKEDLGSANNIFSTLSQYVCDLKQQDNLEAGSLTSGQILAYFKDKDIYDEETIAEISKKFDFLKSKGALIEDPSNPALNTLFNFVNILDQAGVFANPDQCQLAYENLFSQILIGENQIPTTQNSTAQNSVITPEPLRTAKNSQPENLQAAQGSKPETDLTPEENQAVKEGVTTVQELDSQSEQEKSQAQMELESLLSENLITDSQYFQYLEELKKTKSPQKIREFREKIQKDHRQNLQALERQSDQEKGQETTQKNAPDPKTQKDQMSPQKIPAETFAIPGLERPVARDFSKTGKMPLHSNLGVNFPAEHRKNEPPQTKGSKVIARVKSSKLQEGSLRIKTTRKKAKRVTTNPAQNQQSQELQSQFSQNSFGHSQVKATPPAPASKSFISGYVKKVLPASAIGLGLLGTSGGSANAAIINEKIEFIQTILNLLF